MRDVAVIGVGVTKFGELWEKSLRDLIVEAGLEAMYDANVTSKDIDALYGGNMSSGLFVSQEHTAALIGDFAGLASYHIPATRVEAACASGGVALRQGYISVASGIHDIVIVGGVEKMTDVSGSLATDALASAGDREWEAFLGVTFPGLYAMIARRHMHEYKTTKAQLGAVAVKNHRNGALNPKAQYQKELTLEQVLNATMVAEPLGLFDCSPISDGAAALILCPLERAKEFTNNPVKIIASSQASDTLSLHSRRDICTMDATVVAAKNAYRQANKKPKDINLVEVHDCFTITEILAIEDLGFVKKGEGGKATENGLTALNGEIPVNPSGGLKSKGHPVGATGVAQAVEIATQLRGKAGKRQVKDARVGMTHNVGGSGATAVVHIFEVI
ncbi:MAG: thiolase domain-containing protein [Thermoplasmatales archaeon]|nr:thiolase domain-containing protein [Thermoplasmatales archaeon]